MEARLLAYALLFVAVSITLFITFSVLRARSLIEAELQEQGCRVTSVRWRPFPWWSVNLEGALGFVVTYIDLNNTIITQRCRVIWGQVEWVSDDARYLDGRLGVFSRVVYFAIAVALAGVAIRLLWRGELKVGSNRTGQSIQIHGLPLAIISIAALSQAAHCAIHATYVSPSWQEPRRLGAIARITSIAAAVLFFASFGALFYQLISN